jgi:hypothetical protein
MKILEEKVTDASAWRVKDFTNDRSWVYELDSQDLTDLEGALERTKSAGLNPPDFGPEDFELPTLKPRLNKLMQSFEHGRGFFLLRGLPVDRYSLDDIKALYWGIGIHLAKPVLQNKRGDLVSHIEDKGDDYGQRNVRLYTTAAAANPHNDPSDVVGLLCVRTSPSGGTSMIASATSIYNRILETHPEYLEVLYRGFPHDLRAEGATGALDETTPPIPIYSYFEGKLSCCINSKSSRTARELLGQPLTQFEQDAIRCVEELAVDPQFCMTMDFRPGDIQFLNNYTIIHTRTAFQDGRALGERRLLLRLWMNLRDGRPLAPGFGDRFNNGSRGGVPARSLNTTETT